MSDTDGMVRLMEHAADGLAARIGNLTKLGRLDSPEPGLVASTIAAMAYGRAVLQMVAASVAPEGNTLIDKLSDYPFWADEHDDAATISDTELASVRRYLREVKS